MFKRHNEQRNKNLFQFWDCKMFQMIDYKITLRKHLEASVKKCIDNSGANKKIDWKMKKAPFTVFCSLTNVIAKKN